MKSEGGTTAEQQKLEAGHKTVPETFDFQTEVYNTCTSTISNARRRPDHLPKGGTGLIDGNSHNRWKMAMRPENQ